MLKSTKYSSNRNLHSISVLGILLFQGQCLTVLIVKSRIPTHVRTIILLPATLLMHTLFGKKRLKLEEYKQYL